MTQTIYYPLSLLIESYRPSSLYLLVRLHLILQMINIVRLHRRKCQPVEQQLQKIYLSFHLLRQHRLAGNHYLPQEFHIRAILRTIIFHTVFHLMMAQTLSNLEPTSIGLKYTDSFDILNVYGLMQLSIAMQCQQRKCCPSSSLIQYSLINQLISQQKINSRISTQSQLLIMSALLPSQQKYKSLTLLVKLAVNCGLSAFYYGYCLTYFNSINYRHIVSIFHLETYPKAITQGLLTGSTCFTAAIGTILSTQLINTFSRRQSLMLLNFLAIFVTLLSLIPSIYTLVFARIAQGLIIGNISCITPLYIRQIMPKEVSGPLWSLHQVLFVIGVSFGFLLTFILGFFADPIQSWRIIFGFPLVTAIAQLINFKFFFVFDTPKWYILQGDQHRAKQAIQYIYKSQFVDSALNEVIQANNYNNQKHVDRNTKLSQAFEAQIQLDMLQADGSKKAEQKLVESNKTINNKNKTTNNSLAIFAAFFLIGQQQFLGGVITQQYCNQMTLKTFPNLQRAFPVVVGLVGIFGSVYSIELMRKWGRRQILLGGVLSAGSCLLVGFLVFWKYDMQNVNNNSVFFRIIFFIVFLILRLSLSCAMGPVPWLYIAEIVQPHIVPWCSLLNWAMLGLITTLFPVLCEINNGNPAIAFFIFSCVAFFSFVVNQKVIIETKNKTELEIRKQYDQLCN